MNHLPIYILALIVLGIIIWHKVNKWIGTRDYYYRADQSFMLSRKAEHRPKETDQRKERILFESRRGKVSFK